MQAVQLVWLPADGEYLPPEQATQLGVAVGVHVPFKYIPTPQLLVQGKHDVWPAPEYEPVLHPTQVGVDVAVQLPLRYCPAGQLDAQAVQLV